MDLAVLRANLRRLRQEQKVTQAAVAEAAGMSRIGYRNIENGRSAPRAATLMRIAAAFDVGLAQLVTPIRTLSKVRLRAEKKMTTRRALLVDIARRLDDYNEVERLLGDDRKFKLAPLREAIRKLPKSQRAERAAALVRKKLGLTANEPIPDLCALLEDSGIKILAVRVTSSQFFGMSVAETDGGPAIVVNKWEPFSVERWIFTAVHELGHLMMHLRAYDVHRTDEDELQEREADTFANHFLMPDELFQKELDGARGLPLVQVVFKLKRIFRTSWQSVLYRIAEKASDPSGRKALWTRFHREHYALTGKALNKIRPEAWGAANFVKAAARPRARAADEPDALVRSDFVEARLFRLVRRALEAGDISLGRAAEILRLDLEAMRERTRSWSSFKTPGDGRCLGMSPAHRA